MNAMTTRRRMVIAAVLALAASGNVSATSRPKTDAYTWRNVEIVGGGYVPGIIFNASEPDLVYARTDIGGAYRWSPRTNRSIRLLDWVGWDNWGHAGVDSLATDPVDPDRVYVLAGTYTNAWDPANGAVLRSRDRGRTWRRTDLPFKSGGNMPGRNMGERLAIDPNKNSVLYLGARSGNGLWRSTNYGVTWSRVTSFPAVGSYAQDPSDSSGYLSDPVGIVWVVFDARTGSRGHASQTIYVGAADLGTSIYRSTDGGATWAALPGQPTAPPFMPHHAVLAPTGMMYVTYNNKGGPYDGEKGDVWKYDTATGAWTLISPIPSSSGDNYFGYGGLAVDAQHPDTVMVAALNSWWPDTMIWRSTNGGASWTRIWDWGPWPDRILRYTQDITASPWLTFGEAPSPPVPSPKLGWMVGDLEIDPFDSNRMLYGTGATIYASDDLSNWDTGNSITITVRAQGLEETAVQDLISPPEGAPLLSALADIAGFRHDDLSVVPPSMFTNPRTGTTTSLDYAERSPSLIFRVGWGESNAGYSLDGGSTWTPVSTRPDGVAGAGVVALSADGASVVWSPANTSVHFSTDNGASWTASSGVPGGARVASDRVNPNKYYAFAGGTFYVSTDDGATFTATAASGLPALGGVRFKAVPGHQGHVWLAGAAPKARTACGSPATRAPASGRFGTWMRRTRSASARLRAGTVPALYTSARIDGVRGIYRSDNEGRSWERINDDQHQYAWTGQAITGDPRVYGRVYVSTNGRGVIVGEPRRHRHGDRDCDDDHHRHHGRD